MASLAGNLYDYAGNPRPGLFPQIVVKARDATSQGSAVFFTVRQVQVPASDGSFVFSLINSAETFPNVIYDAWIEWLDEAGHMRDFDQLGVLIPSGVTDTFGAALTRPRTALEVHIGEENDLTYGFWYQPSIAFFRSNP